jgi:inner membrane protein
LLAADPGETLGERYTVRIARLSLAPGWLPAALCPSRIRSSITAPLVAAAAHDTAEVDWDGELTMPRQSMEILAASNCEFRAFLRFARVPWTSRSDGRLIAGDLRYDREPELGFAEIELDEPPRSCPPLVPPWLYPRSDLFWKP